jgi:hypothetical protein
MVHQIICTLGRLFVLGGAIWKGRSEYKEMTSLGIRKYFQTTVKINRIFDHLQSIFSSSRVLVFLKIV